MKPLLPGTIVTIALAAVAFPPIGRADVATGRPDGRPPNVILILADDLGYADLGCQGSRDAKTPHIDSLAAHGVRCTSGYVTAPQCSPSRAGLITGRYQNRFGFEANWLVRRPGVGLPVGQATMADRLKAAGYATGMIGKWGLGDSLGMRPWQRGFMQSLWTHDGGVYWPNSNTGWLDKVFANDEPAPIAEYSADAFGRAAVRFVEQHSRKPFFLYLAFVNPHWPMEAKAEDLARFASEHDRHRRTLLALIASLDHNVGRVLAALRKAGIEEHTMIFFLSDNGGATGQPRAAVDAPFEFGMNASRNEPLRGGKSTLFEGGIRVPFLVQWKAQLPEGTTLDAPVIGLDILPTVLAAARIKPEPDWMLDGVDLLPFLNRRAAGSPHQALYWRYRFPPDQPGRHSWAVREGPWKLIKAADATRPALYNLQTDVAERTDLAASEPERVQRMSAAWRQWDAANRDPLWLDARPKPQPSGPSPVRN